MSVKNKRYQRDYQCAFCCMYSGFFRVQKSAQYYFLCQSLIVWKVESVEISLTLKLDVRHTLSVLIQMYWDSIRSDLSQLDCLCILWRGLGFLSVLLSLSTKLFSCHLQPDISIALKQKWV